MGRKVITKDGKEVTKRSGASTGQWTIKENKKVDGVTYDLKGKQGYITNGWFLQNMGNTKHLVKVKCVTTYKSSLSDSGWFGNVFCTFTNTETGELSYEWGTMQKSTGKVIIENRILSVNPSAPNGGYCGKYGQDYPGRPKYTKRK